MSFDILAPHYRWMEFVLAGEKLQRCRTAFLDEIPLTRSILLAGEGPGRCLVECCQRFPQARIVCVDASERMLVHARHRAARKRGGTQRIEFVHADIVRWRPPAEEFSLIITNFFLDCFRPDQLDRVVSSLAGGATQDAHWLLADFQVASGKVKRIRSRVILWGMYAFFRKLTRLPADQLTAPDLALERSGFRLHRRVETEWGLLHSDWWQRRRDGADARVEAYGVTSRAR